MSSGQWLYRMYGEQFGPVSFERLRDLVAQHTVSEDDEVCEVTAGVWMSASHAVMVAEVGTAKPAKAKVESSKSAGGLDEAASEEWFCLINNTEFGPSTFAKLLMMAEQGELRRDDEIKLGLHGRWRKAGSVSRLQAVMPFQASANSQNGFGLQTANDFDFTVSDTIHLSSDKTPNTALESPHQTVSGSGESGVVPVPGHAPIDPADTVPDWASATAWGAFVENEEYGPVDIAKLREWALNGQLLATDFVRQLPNGEWQAAKSVPGLFMQPEAAPRAPQVRAPGMRKGSSDSSKTLSRDLLADTFPLSEPDEPPKPNPKDIAYEQFLDSVSQEEKPREKDKSKSRPSLSKSSVSAVKLPAPENRRSGPQPTAAIAATASALVSDAADLSPDWGKPAAPPPAAPRPAVRKRSDDDDRSSLFADLLSSIKANPAGIGTVVALTLFLAWFFLPADFFGPNGNDLAMYQFQKTVLAEVKALREKNAPGAEWEAAIKKFEPELKTQVTKLEKTANSANPSRKHLLWNAKLKFREMMGASRTAESASEKQFSGNLDSTARYLKLKDAPPIEIVVTED